MEVPYPFKTVATAMAFSPYAEANLHESARIAKMLSADLVLVHVGKKTAKKEDELERMIRQTEQPRGRVKIEWKDGDPVESILSVCKDNNVDLLIAGAMKKENLLRFYTGSIARKLCRKADCSILLLTDRSVVRNKCKQIIVSGTKHRKTETTIKTANYMAKVLGAEQLTIVGEIDPKTVSSAVDDDQDLAIAAKRRKELKTEENERIRKIEEKLKEEGSVAVNHKCIFGKVGYTIGHFAQSNHADLLVMNSPDTVLGLMDRVFTHDLEFVLSDLPCCLMIVRKSAKAAI